jgi:nicotinamide-nucleotide amidase
MPARAGIVVTGTEVLSGRVRDRNGPWLSDRLLELGVELAHITICGDRREDMLAQLSFMADQGVDVVITSGGLGPTADDLTIEIVAEFTGRPLFLDADLEARIAEILRPLMKRFPDLDFEAVRASNRKQALVPEGAHVIYPAGTAPGLVVPGKPAVVVLPGPPRELHAMWPEAVSTDAFQAAVEGRVRYSQQTLRLFGIPESEIAETLRVAERSVEGFEALEITTCLRRGEVEMVTRWEPEAEGAWEAVSALVAERHPRALFSVDGSRVDDQVASLLAGRSLAVAESCTGGLMAARVTERAGASAYFAGGVVAYSNEAKAALLGVDPGLIERHGAVSLEAAEAMAEGALDRFQADVALSITGVAGPGGGTEAKPVGYVCWSAALADGTRLTRDTRLPGDRADIRDRSTTVGMHLLRRLLTGDEAGDLIPSRRASSAGGAPSG